MFDSQKRDHGIAYAQNFLKNPSLGRYIVGLANLTAQDTVVEVGPGKGMLTRALFSHTKKLVLVEKDKDLYESLHKKYQTEPTVEAICTDVLKFRAPAKPYKVVSNPPFNILSQLVKKFVLSPNSPDALYLFMQKEAEQRLCGKPSESQLSILIKSFYEVKQLHRFARTDFSPVPAVDVNFVGFFKKDAVHAKDTAHYIAFVEYGFGQQKSTLAKNFERIFTYEQWKRLAGSLKFSANSQVTDLTPEQWVGLFNYYKSGVSPDKQRLVSSLFNK